MAGLAVVVLMSLLFVMPDALEQLGIANDHIAQAVHAHVGEPPILIYHQGGHRNGGGV